MVRLEAIAYLTNGRRMMICQGRCFPPDFVSYSSIQMLVERVCQRVLSWYAKGSQQRNGEENAIQQGVLVWN